MGRRAVIPRLNRQGEGAAPSDAPSERSEEEGRENVDKNLKDFLRRPERVRTGPFDDASEPDDDGDDETGESDSHGPDEGEEIGGDDLDEYEEMPAGDTMVFDPYVEDDVRGADASKTRRRSSGESVGFDPREIGEQRDDSIRPSKPGQYALAVLESYIPIEVVTLWATLTGLFQLMESPVYVSIVSLIVVTIVLPGYLVRYTIDKPADIDEEVVAGLTWHVAASIGAFLVWAYYLGTPFVELGLREPSLATLLVFGYPVVISISPYWGGYWMLMLRRTIKNISLFIGRIVQIR